MSNTSSPLDRRAFMKLVINMFGGVIAAMLGLPAVAYVIAPALKEKAKNWIRLGSASKVSSGEPTLFKASVNRTTGWISDTVEYQVYVRTDDGHNFRSLSNVCTHLGCRVRWIEEKGIFFCPCHNAQFDKDGNVLAGPPPHPLVQLQTKVEDDQIYIFGG